MVSSSQAPNDSTATRLRAELEAVRLNLAQLTTEKQRWERATSQAVERERRMLAQTLHDTLSQSMTGAYLQAQVIVKKLQKKTCDGVQEVAELTEMIHSVVLELTGITRELQREADSTVPVPVPVGAGQ